MKSADSDETVVQTFAERLRLLQAEAGSPSVREIESGLRRRNTPYSRSAIQARLSGITRADWEFVKAFLSFCYSIDGHKTSAPALEDRLEEMRVAHRHMLGVLAGVRRHGKVRRGAELELRGEEVVTERSSESISLWQIPQGSTLFLGQHDLLERLLVRACEPGVTKAILLDGMPGVGKTEIAFQLAQRLRESYPDGGYFLDLFGYTPTVDRLKPVEAIGLLLEMLGESALPQSLGERITRWNSIMTEKKAIVVLDNVADSGSVDQLIPRSTKSLFLLTSRNRLPALPRVTAETVETLSPDESAEMIRGALPGEENDQAVGAQRVSRFCGYLPLAIQLILRQHALDPARSLNQFADDLEDAKSRLIHLSPEEAGVNAAFGVSYQLLSGSRRRVFTCCGILPGSHITTSTMTSLLGSAAPHALRDLANLSLLRRRSQRDDGDETYQFHDLIRLFAKQKADEETTARTRKALITRLASHYTKSANLADTTIRKIPQRAGHAQVGAQLAFAAQSNAIEWIVDERENIRSVLRIHDSPDLARFTAIHLAEAGYVLAARQCVLPLLDSPKDAVSVAEARLILGRIESLVDNFNTAREEYASAAEILRSIAAPRRLADAVDGLALINQQTGEYELAREGFREALSLYEELNDPIGTVQSLAGLGMVARQVGDYEEGRRRYLEAYSISINQGDRLRAGRALHGLAAIERHMGLYEDSRAHYFDAREELGSSHDQLGEANVLWGLGDLEIRTEDFDRAREFLDDSLERYSLLGSKIGQANALRGLGVVASKTGDEANAHRLYSRALELYREADDRLGEASALESLGLLDIATGRPNDARRRLSSALGIYEELGVPQAEGVREQIANI